MATREYDPANWDGYVLKDVAGNVISADALANNPNVFESQDQNGVWRLVDYSGHLGAVEKPDVIEWVDKPGTGDPAWVQMKVVNGVPVDEARPGRTILSEPDAVTYQHFVDGGSSDAGFNDFNAVGTGGVTANGVIAKQQIAQAKTESGTGLIPPVLRVLPTGGDMAPMGPDVRLDDPNRDRVINTAPAVVVAAPVNASPVSSGIPTTAPLPWAKIIGAGLLAWLLVKAAGSHG